MYAERVFFGSTELIRTFCKICERYCFVLDNKKQCCGEQIELTISGIGRQGCQPIQKRKPLKKISKEKVLRSQDYRCLYCDKTLDGYVVYHKKFVKIKIHWDHMVPFALTMDNSENNYAASCQFCNQWKHDKVFSTVEEVRIYVTSKWEREGSREENLSSM